MATLKITDRELEDCLEAGMKPPAIARQYAMSIGAVTRRINVLKLYKAGATALHAKEIAEAQIDVLHTTHAQHQIIFETLNETRDDVEEMAALRQDINRAIAELAGTAFEKRGPGRPKKGDLLDGETAQRDYLIRLLEKYFEQIDPRQTLIKLSHEQRGITERYEQQVRLVLDTESLKMLVDTLVVIYGMVDQPVRTKITQALLAMPSSAGRAILGIDRFNEVMGVTREAPPEAPVMLPVME